MLLLDDNVNVDVVDVDVDVVGVGVRKASIPDSSWITSVVVKTIVLNDLIGLDLIFFADTRILQLADETTFGKSDFGSVNELKGFNNNRETTSASE